MHLTAAKLRKSGQLKPLPRRRQASHRGGKAARHITSDKGLVFRTQKESLRTNKEQPDTYKNVRSNIIYNSPKARAAGIGYNG